LSEGRVSGGFTAQLKTEIDAIVGCNWSFATPASGAKLYEAHADEIVQVCSDTLGCTAEQGRELSP